MKKSLFKLTFIGAIFLLLSSSFALSQNKQWIDVNLAVVDTQITPNYIEFKDSSERLYEYAQAFCSDPNQQSLQDFQQSYHLAMDAWQGIQHIQFGPVTYFNWNFRVQYWPDNKGTGSRQLSSIIAASDESVLGKRNFERQSVGVQGFPALENLLFDENSLEQLSSDAFRCDVALAITNNLNTIASGVTEYWQNEFRSTVANADNTESSDQFESAEDASIDLLKSIVEMIPKIIDQKLTLPLGNSFDSSRVRRSESWRSQRSIANIKINIESLSNYFLGSDENVLSLSSLFLEADVQTIKNSFNEVEALLATLPDSMVEALQTESDYQTLEALKSQLAALDEALEAALKNTDLYLGFNSLDGD